MADYATVLASYLISFGFQFAELQFHCCLYPYSLPPLSLWQLIKAILSFRKIVL